MQIIIISIIIIVISTIVILRAARVPEAGRFAMSSSALVGAAHRALAARGSFTYRMHQSRGRSSRSRAARYIIFGSEGTLAQASKQSADCAGALAIWRSCRLTWAAASGMSAQALGEWYEWRVWILVSYRLVVSLRAALSGAAICLELSSLSAAQRLVRRSPHWRGHCLPGEQPLLSPGPARWRKVPKASVSCAGARASCIRGWGRRSSRAVSRRP